MKPSFVSLNYRIAELQARIYGFLERPMGTTHFLYHLAVFSYVLITLCLSAILSLEEDTPERKRGSILHQIVFAMEMTLAVYFTGEFALRIWCVGYNARYSGWKGRLRFCTRFITVVDILIVGATLFLLVFGTSSGRFIGSKTVQNLRFLQILRMLHVDRDASTWKIMEKILYLHKEELIAAYYLTFLGLLVMSSIVYITESSFDNASNEGKDPEDHTRTYNSYGDAIWWGVITLMAVGYGDIVPKHWLSKVCTCIFAVLCVSLFTMISSVIGVGLTLMVQDKERQKQITKQKPHAAKLIQAFYRLRLMRRCFNDIPYYRKTLVQKLLAHELKIHLSAAKLHHGPAHPSQFLKSKGGGLIDMMRKTSTTFAFMGIPGQMAHHSSHHQNPSSEKRVRSGGESPNRSQHSNFLTVPGQGPSPHTPLLGHSHSELGLNQLAGESSQSRTQPERTFSNMTAGDSDYSSTDSTPAHHDTDPERGDKSCPNLSTPPGGVTPRFVRRSSSNINSLGSSMWALDFDSSVEVPNKYIWAIIAVWEMRLMGAKKKFARVRRPYDLIDISDEVSDSEHFQMNKLREIQLHVEHVIGKPSLSLLTRENNNLGLIQRLELVEIKMAELDKKADLILEMATQLGERVISLTEKTQRMQKERHITRNQSTEHDYY